MIVASALYYYTSIIRFHDSLIFNNSVKFIDTTTNHIIFTQQNNNNLILIYSNYPQCSTIVINIFNLTELKHNNNRVLALKNTPNKFKRNAKNFFTHHDLFSTGYRHILLNYANNMHQYSTNMIGMIFI